MGRPPSSLALEPTFSGPSPGRATGRAFFCRWLGSSFLAEVKSGEELAARNLGLDADDPRTLSDLLFDQVEFANVLVINKTDLVPAELLHQLEALLRTLNPSAKIVRSTLGQVPLEVIFDTGLFDLESAQASPAWQAEEAKQHVPESEEYGISSFTFRSSRPFHPERLWDFFHEEWAGVIRSKGFFWIATRPELAYQWSQAGPNVTYAPQGLWPEETAVADRHQEIVVIGIEMDRADIEKRFDACLLTTEELALGQAYWQSQPDPFPEVSIEDLEEEEHSSMPVPSGSSLVH